MMFGREGKGAGTSLEACSSTCHFAHHLGHELAISCGSVAFRRAFGLASIFSSLPLPHPLVKCCLLFLLIPSYQIREPIEMYDAATFTTSVQSTTRQTTP
jgi:hypothetical protein